MDAGCIETSIHSYSNIYFETPLLHFSLRPLRKGKQKVMIVQRKVPPRPKKGVSLY